MNFAQIGLGSFGTKRANAIKNSKNGNLLKIFDIKKEKLDEAVKVLDSNPAHNLEEILNDKNIEAISISTPNKFHKDTIIQALKNNKFVFCEKPLSLNLLEAKEICEVAKNFNNRLQIGSNHRYFESVKFAKNLVEQNEIGEILSFSGRIGHDGERIKNSWFWNKDISGGGTLIDNGCHLLDLSRFFLGDFVSGKGLISNIYWKDMNVEDTAFGNFKTKEGKVASIFCSWRLLSGYFFIELNGTQGYINIDGRFDTHGGDKIYWKNKKKEIQEKDFSKIKPNSYVDEINQFIENIQNGKKISPSAEDGLEVMKMVDYIYNE